MEPASQVDKGVSCCIDKNIHSPCHGKVEGSCYLSFKIFVLSPALSFISQTTLRH